MKRDNVWKKYTEEDEKALEAVCAGYRAFLDRGKTERECVSETVRLDRAAGYRDIEEVIGEGRGLKEGDKVYAVNMKKTIALFHIGRKTPDQGMMILGAHIDSPRLDIK